MNFTVDDIRAASRFYESKYPEAVVSDGVFAGIDYRSLIGEDGEVVASFFTRGAGNPLADSFTTLMVASVPASEQSVQELGGRVVIPENQCPCTGAPFAVYVDAAGNQFMIKQPRA
jgi:predicted enzyme related to lactoylglutathione lyase